MKLYTKTGDDGSTGLHGGGRVAKDHPRVEAYGAVDEANAAIGAAHAVCSDSDLRAILETLMARMFDVGADLATLPNGKTNAAAKVVRVSEADCAQVERWIDAVDGENEAMKAFVLPGGTEPASRLHIARTVVRRAERRVVTLAAEEPVGRPVVVFLNRCGDLLFAMARLANRRAGVADIPWAPRASDASS
ncbi:MAG: cob(I)yrinic acid a,c-diamide adenosyltransferase [Phycisphaerales bacterium]|nr:cob(I)yrinic acid a,c-diamide adenosyltransferase [Phycisphaerales bacterium]